MCFLLNIPDDQLPGLAIAGMLPAVREKLFGQHFDDLGLLGQRLGMMGSQFQNMRREPRFQKDNAFAEMYQQFLVGSEEEDYEEEVALALPMDWGKKTVEVPDIWKGEKVRDRCDFNIGQSDKLFALLVQEGIIKLPTDHSMLAKGAVKPKQHCALHDTTSHNLSECRAFKQMIQKAIQSKHLVFGNKKMQIDSEPFPSIGMVAGYFPKGKVKVLTSDRAKEAGAVDPKIQITARENKQDNLFQNSRTEKGESSSVSKPRVTSRILLNK